MRTRIENCAPSAAAGTRNPRAGIGVRSRRCHDFGCSRREQAVHHGARDDDRRMADDIMAVEERVARLEKTVATGFSELNGRITSLEHRFDALDGKFNALERKFDTLERKVDGLDARVDALNGKLDVVSESLEDKMQPVLERLDSLARSPERDPGHATGMARRSPPDVRDADAPPGPHRGAGEHRRRGRSDSSAR